MQYAYNYSLIDGSILDEDTVTFDTDVALKYLYFILGSIGLMLIIGVTFDVCNLWRIPGEMKKEDSAGTVCFHCSTLPQILNAKVHMYTSKNAQTICYKSVIKLSTNCIRTACSHFVVTSLEHAVNNFKKAYLVCISFCKIFATSFISL